MSSPAPPQQPTLLNLATPNVNQISTPAMDYFLIEMVSTLRESAAVAVKRQKEVEKEMREGGLVPVPQSNLTSLKRDKDRDKEKDGKESARDSVTSLASSHRGSKALDKEKEDEEEPLRQRLESIGTHVGANIAERLSSSRQPFTDSLDMIKFICKDIWSCLYDKQIDNLRTNHRGVYVLQDNAFKPIGRVSSWEGRPEAVRRAKLYAALPAGIIKGVLTRLGFTGSITVTPEITSMPQCTFQVKLPKGL